MPLMKTYISIVFTNGMFSWYTFLIIDAKIKEHFSVEYWQKKTFACAIFGKICYVACAITRSDQLICLHASPHDSDSTGFIDKAALKNKVK